VLLPATQQNIQDNKGWRHDYLLLVDRTEKERFDLFEHRVSRAWLRDYFSIKTDYLDFKISGNHEVILRQKRKVSFFLQPNIMSKQ